MATSEARIAAKPAHPGPTAPVNLLPQREAVEVERRAARFCEEMQTYSEIGQVLARIAAMMSVRAERCADHENAILVERARQALSGFRPPEGLDPAEIQRLRAEVEARALFDPSDEAKQARKYQADAVRSFFRAHKELQRMKREAEAKARADEDEALASFSPGAMTDAEFDRVYAEVVASSARPTPSRMAPTPSPIANGVSEVPFAIGKRH